MYCVETATEIKLDNILYLTDFSKPAEAALPFVTAIAREYGSKIYALHILLSDFYARMTPEFGDVVTAGLEQAARGKMKKIDARLSGLPHQTIVEWGADIWTNLDRMVEKNEIDLLVLGTHGRSGIEKFVLGSVAEQIWRRSNLPVLTIGPGVNRAWSGERFKSVLFATDFTAQSLAGLPYAVSMAREHRAHLVCLHVIRKIRQAGFLGELSAAEAIYHLDQLIPPDAGLAARPELVVKYGVPAKSIIETAGRCDADLIVLGVRDGDRLGITTHVDGGTAHEVVVNASCPVLTVRG
ncbi:MAG TPA: universal stress protein [Terriglobales bacterium]|jgi:nucleotide-binding universal stress UspA family protein|nr:universal stress protein [Terriglobales bacterium]